MNSFQLGALIARAWSDEAFKSKLLERPNEVLKECDIVVPDGTNLRVHANSALEIHIVIPEAPSDLRLAARDGSEDRGGCWLPCRGNNSW
jgi:hypothetical protein